jgi:acetyl-CoA decarbonylase/synthase complex subunit delta
LALLLAGVDMFMMMHPAAIHTVKEVINSMLSRGRSKPEDILDWVSLKI